jgi:hypothetical protein
MFHAAILVEEQTGKMPAVRVPQPPRPVVELRVEQRGIRPFVGVRRAASLRGTRVLVAPGLKA